MLKKMYPGLSLIVLLVLSGCQKEGASSEPIHSKSLGPCYAYQTVMGSGLVAELNSLANCDPTACTGSSVTTTLTSGYFIDPSTSLDYLLDNNATISIATQADILQQGRNFASANFPAGYSSVGWFQFKATYMTHPHFTNLFRIYIEVTYLKCTGGGGGGNS